MITSTRNPLVKALRQLGKSTKARREQGLFLIEGTHALSEAIATNFPCATVCYTEVWQQKNPVLYGEVLERAEQLEPVSEAVIKAIATTMNPDGVIATLPLPDSARDSGINSIGLVLETIQDPGNLGAIIRTAVAAGIDEIWVSQDSVDLTSPKVIRASAGQWFRANLRSQGDLVQTIETYKKQGIKVIATNADAELTYWQADFSQPCLILLGNEGNGLSAELAQVADLAVSIPLENGVESLNLAVSAALILYEAKRQRDVASLD
ncbi:tRNA/rRNA methyltransferase (SpoU) [Thalassoporum mexicanum PCC 7367]|uniref:TrmH family RNA methyltransferase n=1 Tax=Thalassoporum mexicanum TaxID=3457544 RepID=UPI00029F9EC0|nr:RNA methyltransferase [Pseudanabaena sp. PCC 7367]AFY71268.1 tRNA/rRNA methyltransferase (SpoU) [Pseudanabaena sp. PCC 7367]